MDIPILFEDDQMLVINKPPGIVVNRAESVKKETIQDWGEKQFSIHNFKFSKEDTEFIERAGIVHRLDKETSGILLIAKTPEAFIELQRQFKERKIKKTYRAIVHGDVIPDAGEIRAPVGRLPWNPLHFGIVLGGKEAVTKYKKISNVKCPFTFAQGKQMSNKNTEVCSVVEAYPETGRTHQIRVHLKYINHPILGDYLYAGRKISRDDREWVPRVMLHAYFLSCTHPTTGKQLAFTAPIPDDMSRIIK